MLPHTKKLSPKTRMCLERMRQLMNTERRNNRATGYTATLEMKHVETNNRYTYPEKLPVDALLKHILPKDQHWHTEM